VDRVVNSTFVNAAVPFDGAEFDRCTFESCLLMYSGGPLPKLSGCTFSNCAWTFEGAAQRTVSLIRAFAEIMEPDERRLFIENIFQRPAPMGQSHQSNP
jgi:hypothetical protein